MATNEPSPGWALLRSALPYPDPLRRRRIQKAARELITCMPWPGHDATSLDIIQLALLRMLWLQRETRRAARHRQTDAACLLARASAETCLAGLYWLHSDDEVARMRGDNAKSFHRLLSQIADGDPIPPGLIDDIAAEIGPPMELPKLRRMADVVMSKTKKKFAGDIYERFYVPLSMFVSHPTAAALLRHVGSHDQINDTPKRIWTTSSARHMADACMAVLAIGIAEQAHRPSAQFARYADAHMSRTLTPLAVISGRGAIGFLRPSKILRALPLMIELRRYYVSDEAARHTYPERKARMKQSLADIVEALGGGAVPHSQLIVDHFADSLAQPADGEQTSEAE